RILYQWNTSRLSSIMFFLFRTVCETTTIEGTVKMTNPKRVRYSDGTLYCEEYIENDLLHREDGPAFVVYYDNGSVLSESYFVYGVRHRITGPAYVGYSRDGRVSSIEYWIKGKQIDCLPKSLDIGTRKLY